LGQAVYVFLLSLVVAAAILEILVEQAPAENKGTVLGWHGMYQGLGLLIACLLAGGLGTYMGSHYALHC